MVAKAVCPDGVAFSHLRFAPEQTWRRLSDILNKVKRVGICPQPLVHGRICFLPQEGVAAQADDTNIEKLRVVAVSSVVYRAWG